MVDEWHTAGYLHRDLSLTNVGVDILTGRSSCGI